MSKEAANPPEAPKSYAESGENHWPNRMAFYLAAVGSAVGFGNIWRFPALAFRHGGGAFFIPYLMALFLIGLPILILEISLGQYYQTSVVGVYGSMHKKLRGIGVSSVLLSFVLVTYYSALLAWVVNAFFDSFGSEDPWAENAAGAGNATAYMLNEVIGGKTVSKDGNPTRLVWANAAYLLLVWFFIFLCLAFGMKWTGRIAYFTMGFPIILLFVFLFRAVSLEGAGEGIKQYIGQWDMTVLEKGDVWSEAVAQIFFSLSVCFGVMIAYGAACPRTEPALLNSFVVGLSNSVFSFISGLAVFAALGHLSFLTDTPVAKLKFEGLSLVFGTWPVVLGTLPGGEHWVRLLFFNLFLLGIDSAFSLVEAPVSIIMDKAGLKMQRWMVCAIICTLSYFSSLLYVTDAGLSFLDVVDFYINFTLILLGFFETFSAGWIFGIEEQIKTFGVDAVITYMSANFLSVFAASLVWFTAEENNVWGGFVTLIVVYFFFFAMTLYHLYVKVKEDPSCGTLEYLLEQLAFGNVFYLAKEMSHVVGVLPKAWAVLIKQFIPQVLLILFINLAVTKNEVGETKFGHYGKYAAWPYQTIGIASVCFAFVIIMVGFSISDLFASFDATAHGNIKALEYTSTSDSSDEEYITCREVAKKEDVEANK